MDAVVLEAVNGRKNADASQPVLVCGPPRLRHSSKEGRLRLPFDMMQLVFQDTNLHLRSPEN